MKFIQSLIHSKTNLVILGTLSTIVGLLGQVLYEQHQSNQRAFVAQKEKECSDSIGLATTKLRPDLVAQVKGIVPLRQPNSLTFVSGTSYIMGGQSLPQEPRYPGKTFDELLNNKSNFWLVQAVSRKGDTAVVTNPCTPEPFSVSLQNLYLVWTPEDALRQQSQQQQADRF